MSDYFTIAHPTPIGAHGSDNPKRINEDKCAPKVSDKKVSDRSPSLFPQKCALTYLTQMRSNYPLFQSAHLVSDMSKIKKDSARCLREYLRYETNTSQRARKQNNTITHLFLVSDHSSFFWNYCVFYRKTHKYINEHK